jgi:ATP-dependent DNA helicase DinG
VPEVPAVPGYDDDLSAEVRAVFDPDGPLVRALDGFEVRPAQRQMAEHVAEVLIDTGTLLVEAGTGTGKTLAYLVPAVLSGHRILVSTGTKNLQEQIFHKDIPVLRRALDVPFTATYMKGRGNYLCLHRYEAFGHNDEQRRAVDPVHLVLLEEWAGVTNSGDRAELAEVPEDVPWWPALSATTENCMGSSCPKFQDCFVTKMRQQAAASDVVIVNHHLLCADAAVRQHSFGEVIPECQVAVVDEAHQLEDVATQYFGVAVSTYRVDDLGRDTDRVVTTAAMSAVGLLDARAAIAGVRSAATTFFADLRWRRQGTGERVVGGGLFDERVRLSEAVMAGAVESGLMLITAVDSLAETLGRVRSPSEELENLCERCKSLGTDLRFLLACNDPAFVFFLEVRGRGVFLKASPVDVSRIVREHLLDRMRSVVLTSATLAINGSFDYVKARLGVTNATCLRLASEFDYTQQALLYLPKRMPDPRSAEFVERAGDEVVELLQRSEGRAFVLLTSYAMLRALEARLRNALPYPLLVQGSAPRTMLLDQFRSTPNAVLLATSSFWQGVDVVGEALSCVIIDKLPFASPSDPITAARIEAIANRGGRAFEEYQVPLAILTLLQGVGRLLRHRTDRGVLAILDPRLVSKGYGRRFLDSLPPAPVTRQLEDVSRFFGETF